MSLYRIRNCVVVAVEVEIVSDAVGVGVDGRSAKLIPGSVTIGISKASSGSFSRIDRTIHVDVSRNRYSVAAFVQVTDTVVVTVEIAVIADTVTVGVCRNDRNEGKGFVGNTT